MNEGQEQNSLHDRIAHARARRSAVWRYLLLGCGWVALLAAIGGGGIWIGFLLSQDAPLEEAVEDAAESAPGTVTSSRQSVTIPSPSAPPASPSPKTPSPASRPPSPVTPLDATAARQGQFQAALRDFERTREVDLARIHSAPVPGPRAARARIALNKEKALAAYDDGDVDSALRLLGDATREAGDVLRDAKARYQRHIQAAKAAYADGDTATARRHIAQARKQWPDHADAKAWEARIAQRSVLLAEREKAEQARTSGDRRAEQAALRRIVERDPTDADARSRILAIDEQVRDQAFLRAIARGWKAVDDTDTEGAAQALAEAEQAKPRDAETLRLKAQVAALTRIQARDRHLAVADRAVDRDDWPAALRAFEEAQALAPTHKDAMDGRLRAAGITAAQKAVDMFLARPDRLRDTAVAEAARKTLRDAAPLTTHSPRLTASHAALARAIHDRQTPVQVLILSDNQTEIGIQGVGALGRLEQHILELRPGAYVFEGRRKGYRSKLVTVDVPVGESSAEVRIVCDERI